MGRVAYIDGRNLQQSYSNGVNSNYHCSDRNVLNYSELAKVCTPYSARHSTGL